MQKNKLLKFLEKLSPQEIKDFKISYMNKLYDKKSVPNRLLNYLYKYYPDFSSDKLDAEKIHKYVFKDKAYNRNDVLNAFSDLRKELKRFLIWNSKDDFTFEKESILLQLFERYNLNNHFDVLLNSMNNKVEKEKEDIWKWSKKMRLAHENYFDPKKIQINLNEEFLLKAMDNLDRFYFTSKLKYACELQNRNQILQNELPNIKLLEALVNEAKNDKSLLLRAFFLAHQLFQSRDENIYAELKDTVTENFNTFSKENQHIFLTYLINHHNYRKKNGLPASRSELLDLFKFGVKHEIFIVDGVFDVNHFNNIVDLGCKQKELIWTESFIKKYSPKLKDDIRLQTESISEISLLFAKGYFEKVIELIRTSEFNGIHNKLRFRCMQIISYFELDFYSPQDVMDLCVACENFARKNTKIGEDMKQALLKFTRNVKRLVNNSPHKVKTELERGGVIYFEDWLKEKVLL